MRNFATKASFSMDFTPIARLYFSRLDGRMLRAAANAEDSQRRILKDLISSAKSTEWGESHSYRKLDGYDDYRSAVGVCQYEDIRQYVTRMLRGESDVLCRGTVNRYAQSSGTSGGKSKYIPLPDRSLKRCHYAGGADVVARYLALHPDSRLFSGRAFVLGGSFANELDLPRGVKVGDLSASLIDCLTPAAAAFRVPSKEIALMEKWEDKLPKLVDATLRSNVTNLSGVPSWFLTVLHKVIGKAGVAELHELWPNLEVFFHGGIAFEPYRGQYDEIIDSQRMRYMETYNASEGFFALQSDPEDQSLLLLMDVDVFYEFVPLSELDSDNPKAVPAWEVEKGKIYAMVISSSNGLWRYMIGDTVRIESVNPIKIKIVGRTKSFINAFGEELMVYNADAALSRACAETGATIADYTVAPVYASDGKKGRHQWAVSFGERPSDIEGFADLLDKYLTEENSDYQAKRSGNIFLDRLLITEVPQTAFDQWLAKTGKLGGQRKVPRLKNDRAVIDAILREAH